MSDRDGGKALRRAAPPSLSWGFWVKLALIGLFDALAVVAIPTLFASQSFALLVLLLLSAALVNYAYLSPRATAAKWLTPGLILLGLFVVYPIIYTFYVSVTSWATGNVLTKERAIEDLENDVIAIVGEGVTLDLAIYRNGAGSLAYLVQDPEGNAYFGLVRERTADPIDNPLIDTGDSDLTGAAPAAIGEFEKLALRDLFAIAREIEGLVLDIPGRGVAEVQTTTRARLIQAGRRFTYDPATDTLFDAQENVTCQVDGGNFMCPASEGTTGEMRRLDPGWRTVVGADNYVSVLTNKRIRGPFVQVFTWNVIFATASVFLTFTVGLAIANALQDDRLKGRAFYRSIFILPYAIPGFLSIIIWRGLLNNRYGQVNGLLEVFGVGAVDWLIDPFWAKISVLLVNVWLGFPYMFLVTTGALQAVPAELKEAARVDGAGPWRVFRTVTLPLLLVSTAPLLIGSFAFNFNNFVLIFLLTNGGPPVVAADVPVGHTDLLINFTFDLALRAGRGNNFAIGSAIVIIIFVILAVISAVGFRATRRLEETYGNI